MDGYARREPPAGWQMSANGVKRWAPREPADPWRRRAALAHLAVTLQLNEPEFAAALSRTLRECQREASTP